MTDKDTAPHPADEALDKAREYADFAQEDGVNSSEYRQAAATLSLAWSAISFLSRDVGYQQRVMEQAEDMFERRMHETLQPPPVPPSAGKSMPLLTVPEAGDRLRISRQKAYQMAKSGELPTVRFGGSIRVRPDQLDEYMRRMEERP